MIYTASYFEKSHQIGQLVSISVSSPKGFTVAGQLKLFVPNSQLFQDWKRQRINQEQYIARYRIQIKHSWSKVKTWLDSLSPKEDITLLCWEAPGQFCHRNLVGKIVQKHRPDCWGGADFHFRLLDLPGMVNETIRLLVIAEAIIDATAPHQLEAIRSETRDKDLCEVWSMLSDSEKKRMRPICRVVSSFERK